MTDNSLARPLTPAQRQAARDLLDELESTCLEVILVPQRTYTNHGGMIRVAASRNCRWYRRFCLAHPSTRRRRKAAPDTAIKRAHTRRTLRRLAAGLWTGTTYDHRLLAEIDHRLERDNAAAADRVEAINAPLPAPDPHWAEAFA